MVSNLKKLRHSTAHVLAEAVLSLYPKAKLGIGPSIEDGFYYDFDNLKITEDDLMKNGLNFVVVGRDFSQELIQHVEKGRRI